ncbi:MAG: hypothetical protein R3176_00495 [Woeseiaceae bacterium]|nr:hypothetical protein [Woeseiaceae bacterium]
MNPSDIGRELVYPARNGKVLAGLVMYFLLLELALFARAFGLVLLAVILPAVIRYLMQLLEARSRGVDPGPPGIDTFAWTGNVWSIFPVLHVLVLVLGATLAAAVVPAAVGGLFAGLYGLLLPASLIVLAVTRSPAESLRPDTLYRVIRRMVPGYLVVPAFAAAVVAAIAGLARAGTPEIVTGFLAVYCAFAGCALAGGVARANRLHAEVSIAVPVGPDDAAVAAGLVRDREKVLGHAYGIVSRGNRAGGLAHVTAWLEAVDDPAAWDWFIDRMTGWEDPDAGLMLAQKRLGLLLREGRDTAAVKLMLRCRLVDAGFRPLPGDRPLALAAAERAQHDELVSFLR